jgi:hypothetical protein
VHQVRRQVTALTCVALFAAGHATAQTEVRRSGDKVDVRATAASVSEVLDRLARETGMKVSYDGPPPRARVSMSLTGVTPSQAVLSVLEGQGLNYAMRMDATGTRVETLFLVSSGTAAAPVAAPPRAPQGPRPMVEREPEPPESDEETPSEAPPAPEEKRPGFPFPGFPGPSGPAMPLQLPTPPPVAPSPGAPTAPAPQG